MRGRAVAAVGLTLVGLMASGRASAADERDIARHIYLSRCQSCHGAAGAGDGMMARALKPPPASFVDPAWQAGIDDDGVKKIILEGGLAVGKSPAMPPHGDLARRPGVLKHLVALIRSFGAPAAPTTLPIDGRSDLQVVVEGASAQVKDGALILTDAHKAFRFDVASGVTEPPKGQSASQLLEARARAWLEAEVPGGSVSLEATPAKKTNGAPGAQTVARVSATTATAAAKPDGRRCAIHLVAGPRAGGLVPWLQVSSCDTAGAPVFTLSVGPTTPATP